MDIKRTLKQLALLSVMFYISILISNILRNYVPSEMLESILGHNLLGSITVATLLGVALPLPKYATYPIAHALFKKGAFISAASALIWGEVIISDIACDIMEIKYFGKKFWFTRMCIISLMIIACSLIVEAIL